MILRGKSLIIGHANKDLGALRGSQALLPLCQLVNDRTYIGKLTSRVKRVGKGVHKVVWTRTQSDSVQKERKESKGFFVCNRLVSRLMLS